MGRIFDVPKLHVNALELSIMLKGSETVLTPDSGELIAAKGHLDGCDIVVVYPTCPGVKLCDDAMRALNIFGEETCREAKFSSICALNDFLFIVEAEDTHHRTEDFFSDNFHRIAAVTEDGGP